MAEKIDENMLNEVNALADYALKTSGIKKKLLWEELKCSLAKILATTVKNAKPIPGLNIVAMVLEPSTDKLLLNCEIAKDTKKSKWGENLKKIIKDKLIKEYGERSSEELKSSNPQALVRNFEEISNSVITTIYQRARNTSNKISLGVSASLAVLASVQNPWVIPIATTCVAGCTYMQARINKRNIGPISEARNEHIKQVGITEHQHSQTMDCAQRYSAVKGFRDKMVGKLDELTDDRIKANDEKQDITRKNMDRNARMQRLWNTISVVAPLVLSYVKGGMSFMMESGIVSAASSVALFAMTVPAINNYINSKIEAQTATKMCAGMLKSIKEKDLSFSQERDLVNVSSRDDTIRISRGLTYQHKDFSQEGAPSSGKNVFSCDKDIFIGKGVTILGGASGAGKTTLTSLLRRGALPTTGTIQLGHVENGKYIGNDYANVGNIIDNIGVAFQSSPDADNLTVEEYIMLENPNASEEKVQEVKKLLGIGNGSSGESGIIDENAFVSKKLSGGQQKRIELARALIKDSPILILDEPTSGVDETMSNNIVDYIKELGKDKTIIYITHNADEIEKIGAYQAIDIDKKHSDDRKTNVIQQTDFSDEQAKHNYIEFFRDRKNEQSQENNVIEVDIRARLEHVRERLANKNVSSNHVEVKTPLSPAMYPNNMWQQSKRLHE